MGDSTRRPGRRHRTNAVTPRTCWPGARRRARQRPPPPPGPGRGQDAGRRGGTRHGAGPRRMPPTPYPTPRTRFFDTVTRTHRARHPNTQRKGSCNCSTERGVSERRLRARAESWTHAHGTMALLAAAPRDRFCAYKTCIRPKREGSSSSSLCQRARSACKSGASAGARLPPITPY